jgi:hypothetical protein
MRRWPAAALLYLALAGVLALPLLRAFGSVIPHDIGDPILNSWILWWSTRAVPFTTAWWDAPMFFPMRHALALSEVLVGLLPLSAPVQALTGNPLAAYNTAFVLSFPLSALAARALALELMRGRGRAASGSEQNPAEAGSHIESVAAFAAGLAFAFAPYRMGQLSHLQMLSCYWAPIALFALHRYAALERERGPQSAGRGNPAARWLALFGVAWLMQAWANGYAMFQLAVLIALWLIWFVRTPRELLAIAGAWAVSSLPLVPMLVTYRSVHQALHLLRDLNEVKRFSADASEFLSAPPELALWGGRLLAARSETALFPGLAVLAIGVLALATRRRARDAGTDRPRLSRVGIVAAAITGGAAAVAVSVLMIGPWAIGRLVTVSVFHKPFSIAAIAAVVFLLQTASFRRAWRGRSIVGFYAFAMVVLYVLALGPTPTLLGRPIFYEPPYAWLMRLPGFDVLRVPARFAMLAVLCQSMLVALALASLSRRAILRPQTQRIWLAAACAALLADGWVRLPVVAPPPPGPAELENAAAVLELPAGQPELDFPAIYHGMFHGRPIVNGYSGYAPPHYLPLAHALRDGHYEAIEELAAFGPIAVAVATSSPRAAEALDAIPRLPQVERRSGPTGWTLFQAPQQALVRTAGGSPVPLTRVEPNRQPQDVARLMDGTVASAWGSGADQRGDEVITIDLGAAREVRAVVFRMGAFAFGFPRQLAIDGSTDAGTWSPVWAGPTVIQALHAALVDPGEVPLTIAFAPTEARYLRLRQTGREVGIPWWIGELQVLAP